MKLTGGNKIKLGVFVFMAALLFVLGINYIGERQKIFGNTFRLHALFRNVRGLQVGNNITLSGINVGIIENMEQISDTLVRVDLLVEEKVKKFVKKDAMAVIGTEGLMGNKILILTPGNTGEKEVEHNAYIATTSPIGLDDILHDLKITTEKTANITTDLAAIMDNISSGRGTVGMLFMDTVFASNLYESVVNIKRGAKQIEEKVDAAGKSFLLRGILGDKNKKKEKEKEDTEKKKEAEEEKESKDKKINGRESRRERRRKEKEKEEQKD